MAADAELRLGDLGVLDHAIVNFVAAPISAGFDGVGFFVGEDVFDHAIVAAAVDWLADLARLDPPLAIDLAVLLIDPVAGDAAHAFGRDLAARPERRFARLAELGADLLVAANAEGSHRTLGQLLELLLELVEHRRDRRIGMLRGGPFLIDLFVASATLRSGGIEGEGLPVDRWDGSLFAFRGFCSGSSRFVLLDKTSSAAYGSVAAAAPSFWATVVWLKNAAFISTALAKAQENTEIPDNGFTRSPIIAFGRYLDLHRSR